MTQQLISRQALGLVNWVTLRIGAQGLGFRLCLLGVRREEGNTFYGGDIVVMFPSSLLPTSKSRQSLGLTCRGLSLGCC